MAPCLRHGKSHSHVASRLYAIPRAPIILDSSIYLGATQPRYSLELPRSSSLYCAISTLGPHGVQSRYARDDPKRRDHGSRNWAYVVLLQ